ncbi:hypothetical protein SYNPS1DRAFT_26157 [Syncephalis pseudoplumigaleata]|uniref:Uncharacterized protein n=1 Tax=Syncephalis pseudoplumigaleata TaxID=1712513 RepID=A0A4P9YR46_9FUNG|nr:hypothetical protein SYNPS1DRAFT_26157 [Syncephalis pseudoplumigaleata]|eukprot:RKP22204.1 hypothetical protein SYNPS1DRAFT_26157 [Syncephalis pseudoplumigaleata]
MDSAVTNHRPKERTSESEQRAPSSQATDQKMVREGSGASMWAQASPADTARAVAVPPKPKRGAKHGKPARAQAKLSEEELQARMERIRQQNEELLRRREAVEQDEAAFAKVVEHDKAQQRQAKIERKEKEARERRVVQEVSAEREENARRKLAARQERAWDSDKTHGANGGRSGTASPTSRAFGGRGGRGHKVESGWSSGSERSKSPYSPKFPARKVQSGNGIPTQPAATGTAKQTSPPQTGAVRSPSPDSSPKHIDNIDDLFAWPPPDGERIAWGDEDVSVLKPGASQSVWAKK